MFKRFKKYPSSKVLTGLDFDENAAKNAGQDLTNKKKFGLGNQKYLTAKIVTYMDRIEQNRIFIYHLLAAHIKFQTA